MFNLNFLKCERRLIRNSQGNFEVEQHEEAHPTKLNRCYINHRVVFVNGHKPGCIRPIPYTQENLTLYKGGV